MSAAIDCDGLRFQFDNTWIALKWDDHVAYRQGLICERHPRQRLDGVTVSNAPAGP